VKLIQIRLTLDPNKSFIFYHDAKTPFAQWHNHPEFEIALVVKGRGKRTIGDMIEGFIENDLLLLGPYLPHEWQCNDTYYKQNSFLGECVVLQFDYSFMGGAFFRLPENKHLTRILSDASMGCKFKPKAKNQIIPILKKMIQMDDTDRFYAFLSIIHIFTQLKTTDYETLSSPNFIENYHNEENEPLKKCVQYLIQNFHQKITKKKMLELSHMSSTAFLSLFKKTYRMTFVEYLIKIRVGYACRLLIEDEKDINAISNLAGFENLSNFYRQFKKIKGRTPSEYRAYKKSL
jgi:AraC-like DNA-binding protein